MRRADTWIDTCTCGKRSYPNRKAARTARKQTGGGRMSIYRCHHSGHWHIGHTPYAINRGITSRHDYHRGGAA